VVKKKKQLKLYNYKLSSTQNKKKNGYTLQKYNRLIVLISETGFISQGANRSGLVSIKI